MSVQPAVHVTRYPELLVFPTSTLPQMLHGVVTTLPVAKTQGASRLGSNAGYWRARSVRSAYSDAIADRSSISESEAAAAVGGDLAWPRCSIWSSMSTFARTIA